LSRDDECFKRERLPASHVQRRIRWDYSPSLVTIQHFLLVHLTNVTGLQFCSFFGPSSSFLRLLCGHTVLSSVSVSWFAPKFFPTEVSTQSTEGALPVWFQCVIPILWDSPGLLPKEYRGVLPRGLTGRNVELSIDLQFTAEI
jgi:hypothetical protein